MFEGKGEGRLLYPLCYLLSFHGDCLQPCLFDCYQVNVSPFSCFVLEVSKGETRWVATLPFGIPDRQLLLVEIRHSAISCWVILPVLMTLFDVLVRLICKPAEYN
jgi:hypothetical protein